MKKIILIILVSLCILGCRTKRVVKTESKQIDKVEVKEEEKTERKTGIKQSETKTQENTKTEVKEEQKQEVQISGKAYENNPLTFYNVVDGDTIDLFKVTGNADVIFKSYKNTSNSALNSKTNTEYQKKEEASNIVTSAFNKASETVKEAQQKSVEVVKKNFSFGAYAVFVVWGLLIIGLLIGIYYLRKTTFWTKIIKIFRI